LYVLIFSVDNCGVWRRGGGSVQLLSAPR